jgi:hypothetical protein
MAVARAKPRLAPVTMAVVPMRFEMGLATALTMMQSGWRGRAEQFLLEEGAHFQIGLDGPDQPEPKAWVLTMAIGSPAPFSSIVGGSHVGSCRNALSRRK